MSRTASVPPQSDQKNVQEKHLCMKLTPSSTILVRFSGLSLLDPNLPSPDQYLPQLLVHQPTPRNSRQRRWIQIRSERTQLPGWRIAELGRNRILLHVLPRFRALSTGRRRRFKLAGINERGLLRRLPRFVPNHLLPFGLPRIVLSRKGV